MHRDPTPAHKDSNCPKCQYAIESNDMKGGGASSLNQPEHESGNRNLPNAQPYANQPAFAPLYAPGFYLVTIGVVVVLQARASLAHVLKDTVKSAWRSCAWERRTRFSYSRCTTSGATAGRSAFW